MEPRRVSAGAANLFKRAGRSAFQLLYLASPGYQLLKITTLPEQAGKLGPMGCGSTFYSRSVPVSSGISSSVSSELSTGMPMEFT